MSRCLACLPLLLAAVAPPLHAQPELSGYYLNVALWADPGRLSRGGLADLQRLRLMATPRAGPLDLEIAYEQVVQYSARENSNISGFVIAGIAPEGGAWIDLDWTLEESSHLSWRHRIDRLNANLPLGSDLQLTAGRQTISWATTLLLTPADPFAPFDPSDPFREYRAGVDALRARAFTGPFTELELVLRPADTGAGETLTLLGRARTLAAGWEVAAWAGLLHDDAAAALATSGALGSAAVRAEASLRDTDGDPVVRFTLGVDRRFDLFGRDLYAIVEYQHDGFGAAGPGRLLPVLTSDPFARGELQVFGRDEGVVSLAYQIHPLLATNLLLQWNLSDGSALLGPGASYSLSDEITARLGTFLGLGDDRFVPPGIPRTEFGAAPAVVYLSVSAFF